MANNYTLSKHLGESLLVDMHCADSFPVAIVRPTIIGAIAHAPLPGYFGNASGVTASTLAFASGGPLP